MSEIENRIDALLSQMTLEEKVAQLTSDFPILAGRPGDLEAAKGDLALGIGQLTRPISSALFGPGEGADLVNACQRFLTEETRLGIPAIAHEEALSGLQVKGATLFPQAIGQGSSFDPGLVERMAAVIRRQMRAVGIRHVLSPNVDVVRDARWGRVEECYGEDPYLVGTMGTAYVRGLQGENLATGCIATPKHFLGYSAPEGGRNQEPVHVGPRTMREVFGVPFEMAIREGGAHAVMNSYSQIDGVPVQRSREILTDLLRDEYGFEGLLVSDYYSITQLHNRHFTAADAREAAVQAVEAGMDTELPHRSSYGPPLVEAVLAGEVDEATVDGFVRLVLSYKIRLGLLDDAQVDASAAPAAFDTAEDRALAREFAGRSIVLLRNEPGPDGRTLLPLAPGLRSIAVLGPNADRGEGLLGDYSYPVQIESIARLTGDDPTIRERLQVGGGTPIVTVREGVASAFPEAEIRYAPGCGIEDGTPEDIAEAAALASRCEVAVVVVGDQSGILGYGTVGEGNDGATLALPGLQRQLVEAVAATGTPTVVVLTNGRPFVLDWMVETVPVIVEAWFPGEEGGHAIADILTGRINPGAKTCVTFPRHVGLQPFFYNHKPIRDTYTDTTITPVFPFGHGLSYTTFDYSDLALSDARIPTNGRVEIRCHVKNTGERAGDEVVQLYIRDRVASTSRPVLELKGFLRLSLEPGESRQVSFDLSTDRLAFYDPDAGWIVEPGAIEIAIGASSSDLRLRDEIELDGPVHVAGPRRELVTPVTAN